MRDWWILLLLLVALASQSAWALLGRVAAEDVPHVAPRAQAAAYFGLLGQHPAPDVAPHWTPDGDVPLPDVPLRAPLALASPPQVRNCPGGACRLPRPQPAPASATTLSFNASAPPRASRTALPVRRAPVRQFLRLLLRPRR